MAIQVVCSGCRTIFTVSDRFAGRTGPCPKCKQPITVPATATKEVKIQEPAAATARATRAPVTPIVFEEHPIPRWVYGAVIAGAFVTMLVALVARAAWGPGHAPLWLQAAAAVIVAPPCAWLGYELVRNRDLEPYRGRSLLVRSALCGLVQAALWGVRGFLPPDLTTEMWPWVFIAPPFLVAGGLASLATFDLDWGTATAHYALYIMFTALLRWLAGFVPV